MASIDPSSGFCSETKTFHSLRPPVPLPPATQPLSIASYAFSLLPSPLPPNPALIDAATGAAVSYPRFVGQVRSLAHSLTTRLALSKGDVAFVLSPARLDVPLLYSALLSIGAVVSPANPASTPSEIAHQFNLVNPSISFAVSSTASKLPPNSPTVLLDSPFFDSLLSGGAGAGPEVMQSDTAAILFSSGTTGRVKGVELTHRNLIAAAAPFAAAAKGGGGGAAVQMVTVPMFHVFGFVFCVKAVAVGETAVVQTERFDVGRMLRGVARFRVTHLTLAPPALLAMVRACEEEGRARHDLGSLEAVSTGGAPVRAELIRRFVSLFPAVRLSQVPPAELEDLLQEHPDIIEAAVIPYPDEVAGEVPMAFVVRRPQSTLNEGKVIEFVAKQVAPYKKIHRVSFVSSIPKNAAGKILRKDLVRVATSGLSSKM